LHIGAQQFVHSNTNLHLGPLSWLCVTPAYHRLHHAKDARLQASNLGTFFTIWDRMFGTYVPPHELRDLPLGTDEPRRSRIAVVIGV
jgi:sterol desaturase/sphingolipid hydroxylase (fatty acid hydroxylase superfamily)